MGQPSVQPKSNYAVKLKAWITAVIINIINDMLQVSGKRWTIKGMNTDVQMALVAKCSASNNFSTYM